MWAWFNMDASLFSNPYLSSGRSWVGASMSRPILSWLWCLSPFASTRLTSMKRSNSPFWTQSTSLANSNVLTMTTAYCWVTWSSWNALTLKASLKSLFWIKTWLLTTSLHLIQWIDTIIQMLGCQPAGMSCWYCMKTKSKSRRQTFIS